MRYVYCVVISFWLLCLRLVLELAPILVFWSVNQWIVIVNLNLVCYAFVLALKLIMICLIFNCKGFCLGVTVFFFVLLFLPVVKWKHKI